MPASAPAPSSSPPSGTTSRWSSSRWPRWRWSPTSKSLRPRGACRGICTSSSAPGVAHEEDAEFVALEPGPADEDLAAVADEDLFRADFARKAGEHQPLSAESAIEDAIAPESADGKPSRLGARGEGTAATVGGERRMPIFLPLHRVQRRRQRQRDVALAESLVDGSVTSQAQQMRPAAENERAA